MTLSVTIIDENKLTYDGATYKKMKGRTVQRRDKADNDKRAAYMRAYRLRKKGELKVCSGEEK